MFKKIGIGLLVALVLAAGVTGLVLAQDPEPPVEPTVEGECPPCPCEGFGERAFGPGPRGGQRPEALAEALGMTTEELQAALADGQTVAELAEAQGVPLKDVVDALVAPMVERIETMKEQLLERLESGGDVGPGGFDGPPGPMRGGRWGGKGPGFRFPEQMTPPAEE